MRFFPFAVLCALVLAPAAAAARTPREAAQLGINYLSEVTPQWQAQHKCFGCHVQAVTMHALSIAKHNKYAVPTAAMRSVLDGLTTVPGGSRDTHGLAHSGGQEQGEAKSYGGSALAFYDQFVYQDAGADLVATARALVKFQRADGSVHPEVARFPVSPGPVHTTYMAIQTWRQAYARTADDEWRAPLRKSELWLKKTALSYTDGAKPASIQDLNFAILGLIEAGTKPGAKSLTLLSKQLLTHQNDDGGFGFRQRESSNAYATGQTLFALRRLGLNESNKSVHTATKWLVGKQAANGAWSGGGRGKAEALWGVLGLVAIDVAQINVAGLIDGARLDGVVHLSADAKSEKGKVHGMRVFVDDVEVHAVKSNKLRFSINPKTMKSGLHLVDVVAEVGKTRARRRFEVYAGDTFLIDPGSRFGENGTLLTVRNLGADKAGKVRVDIMQNGKTVSTRTIVPSHGPVEVSWDGKRTDKKPSLSQTFVAKLTYVDATGRDRQSLDHLFTHDTLESQRAAFAQVQGRLAIDANEGVANTEVELVNEKGDVVQRQRTTRSGQYRFKNVKKNSKFKVRVRKVGFEDMSLDVDVGESSDAPAPSTTLKRR